MAHDYAEKLAKMTDDEYLREAESMVWLSAYASNNPRSKYHAQCDACYDEAKRRDKPGLYKSAWNHAAASEGHPLSHSDIEAAKAPSDRQAAE